MTVLGRKIDNSSRQADAINTGSEALMKGSKVWVRGQGNSAWEAGEIRILEGDKANVVLEKGNKQLALPLKELVPANPRLQDGIPDLTHLSYLNEPGILYNLHYRYASDDIYTFAGPVLIAVNPCKALPLYTPEVANAYKAGARDVRQSANMPPHIYLVAANAFRRMLREKVNQSLIVNGESGAGKTETTKKAMQYFATLAGGTGVEDQVLETNPILEAFGNAKTLRNHNSSRFGKLIQIHFNQSHHICGANIKTYLLEKSRVVHQLNGERSYHIFYQLVRGASKAMKQELHLPDQPTGFKYLATSGCTEITGVNDAQEFKMVCDALTDIGIDKDQQAALFRLLAGILWLGNIEFEDDPLDRANDATRIRDDAACKVCSELYGTTYAKLNQALTRKRIVTPGEVITKLLNREESRDCRDALAKALYSSVFDWIVARINDKLNTGKSKAGTGLCISILDIYGFEQFEVNSFEQLCINYANERLQQQFTRHLFKLEQQEYESEGIDWTKVEFIDNQECVDCIEMTPPKGLGVLAVLDAQCRFPKSTDASFAQTVKDTLINHPHFEFNPRAAKDFTIVHYAGKVTYSSAGFLDKNRDTLNGDLIEWMISCEGDVCPLVKYIGQGMKDEVETNAKKGQTVGGRFSLQLADLIAELDVTGLHFVRCIKPNFALKPQLWEEAMALHQLKCCGVLEVARIARAGYPTRYTHQMFAERYAILLPREEQAEILAAAEGRSRGVSASGITDDVSTPGAMKACKRLLEVFRLNPEQYQIGYTKVFFKPGVLGYLEDKWAAMQNSVVVIQAAWRMFRDRAKFQRLRKAAIAFQSVYRTIQEKRAYQVLKIQTRAAKIIQRRWRGHYTRTKFVRMQRAAVRIQLAWRKSRFGKRVRRRVFDREKRELMFRLEQDKFDSIRNQYGCDMNEVRVALAAWAAARERNGGGEVDLTAVMENAHTQRAPKAAVIITTVDASVQTDSDNQQDRTENLGTGAVAAAAGVGGVVVGGTMAAAAAGAPGDALSLSGGGGPDRVMSERAREAAAEIQAGRLFVTQDMSQEVDKLKRDVVRLGKRVELEEYQKKRYQTKYEEQNKLWLEQLQVLQQYMQQVRAAFGDARLPPLPTALQAAAANGAVASTEAGGTAPAVSAFAAAAAVLPPPEPLPPADRRGEKLRTFGRPGKEIAVATDPNASAVVSISVAAVNDDGSSVPEVYANGHVDDADDVVASTHAKQNGISGGGGVQNHHPHHHQHPLPQTKRTMPSTAIATSSDEMPSVNVDVPVSASRALPRHPNNRPPTVKRGATQDAAAILAGRLDKDLDMVQVAMEDNVSFINEVAQNPHTAPRMNPQEVLVHTRKKFEVWSREFQTRLEVAEETIRAIDKSNGPNNLIAQQAPAPPEPRHNKGFMKSLFKSKS